MNLTNDFLIQIATSGIHRVNWKNQEMLWSAFVEKLSKTHRTFETYAEYMKADAARQSEIKNVGGYVAGYLAGGKRKKGSVVNRSMIVLDADFPPPGLWEDFLLLYDNAAAMHSTHKHSAERPRIRLIIPMDREIGPDEYEPIARRIASRLNIERIDHTSYEASRLMYWQSTSIDGEYVMKYQDGPRMSADEILGTYKDWKDCSAWPSSKREGDIIRGAIKEQADPLEKKGIVGAWCKTYGMAEVIEKFLGEEYEMCDVPGRYTYREGSTAAGLVVYDDKFAFSHHGTDPASGKLCNAWDLVRIHLYGGLDAKVREGVKDEKKPSQVKMEELALSDERVNEFIGIERLSEARADFDSLDEKEVAEVKDAAAEPEDMSWTKKLKKDKTKNILSTIDNIVIILRNDIKLKGRLWLNTFEMREMVRGDLPWRKAKKENSFLTDRDMSGLRHYLEKTYKINSAAKIEDALNVIYEKNQVHPIREYLNELVWDGEKRVDRLLVEYMGVEDSAYTRAVTRKALTAAVARIMNPGCKFDYVLTMLGRQGLKKSSLVDNLGLGWFSDSFTTVQGKEAYEQLQGAWLIEIAELSGMKKADIETVKHFITKRKDRFRVAFGRRVEEFPRQCIFFATTNNMSPLRDMTGNRRFWPVVVHAIAPVKDAGIDGDLRPEVVGQIWAEAVALYKGGELLYLSPELEAVAAAMQQQHTEDDSRTGMIAQYLDIPIPENWEDKTIFDKRAYLQKATMPEDPEDPGDIREGLKLRTRVCIPEIWCEVLGGVTKDMTSQNTKAIHEIMHTIEGWERGKSRSVFKEYGNQIGYYRVSKTAETLIKRALKNYSKG